MKPDEEVAIAGKEIRRCCGCGVALRGAIPLGHCPRCLVALGLGVPDSGPVPPSKPIFKPRAFGAYELLEQIGRGGMGVVYKARHTGLKRTVALKMMLAACQSSPVSVRRFEIEAEAAARLNHPHIVPIYEIGSEEEQPFISMQLIDGESLARKMADQNFQVQAGMSNTSAREVHERIVQLVASVARAVHYAHENGVLHRDIKPGNILVDAGGQPHLTDFGLATLTDSDDRLSLTGALTGTPSYMAPEQASGAKASVATDVYSVGAVLYELLTGVPPFTGATPIEMVRKLVEHPPPRPCTVNRAIDRDLETICLKCLEKDPASRFASARALAEDLERWLRHEATLARPTSPILRMLRWTRRNRMGASLIVSLFLGLLASLCLVRMVIVQKNTQDHHRKVIFAMLGVSGFWLNPNSKVTIPSERLAEVAATGRIAPTAGKIERYRVGMLSEEDPVEPVIGYGRLLAHLEEKLTDALGHAVLFDLTLFKEQAQAAAITALVNGDVDILKIGAVSYLTAKEANPQITALVTQNPIKNAVIFVRKDSGIKTLADLRGRSIAGGDMTSTTRIWATFHLVQAGVAPSSVAITPHSAKLPGQSRMIDAVLNRGYDAGAMTENAFKRDATTELTVLSTFPSTPVYWLAGSKLPPAVADKLKETMVAIPKRHFKGLGDKVTSYSIADREQLEKLQQVHTLINGEPPASVPWP